MSKKLTFQEIILTLQQFWNDQGCMLMQAYDNEKITGKIRQLDRLVWAGKFGWMVWKSRNSLTSSRSEVCQLSR